MASNNKQLKDLPNNGPGYLMGIIALIGSILFIPVGLVCGIIGLKESKKAGYKNNFALAGVIISSSIMALGLIWFIIVVSFAGSAVNTIQQEQNDAKSRMETLRNR